MKLNQISPSDLSFVCYVEPKSPEKLEGKKTQSLLHLRGNLQRKWQALFTGFSANVFVFAGFKTIDRPGLINQNCVNAKPSWHSTCSSRSAAIEALKATNKPSTKINSILCTDCEGNDGMFGTVSEELDVKVPPSEAWKLYGTLRLQKFVCDELPDMVTKVDVIHGEGGVGTILEVFFAPGAGGQGSFKEKITVLDNERRVKVVEIVEGGALNLGFRVYKVRFEVLEKEDKKGECITRATIEYDLKVEDKEKAPFVFSNIGSLLTVLRSASKYLVKRYNNDGK